MKTRCTLIVLLSIALLHPWGMGQEGSAHDGIRNLIEEKMTGYVEAGGAASILVVQKGAIILEKAYGIMNHEEGYAASTDTVYPIGSITKQFTGAAIMKLASEGKLDTQDPISKYFKGVPESKKAITLHHLLTHTAGLRDVLGPDRKQIATADFLALAMEEPLIGVPGDKYRYSNLGFSLLGILVEQMSGVPYPQYLNDTFFKPLAMTRTGELIPAWDDKKMAIGYRGKRRWGTLAEKVYGPAGSGWNLRANGGMLSTVGDMYRWHKALLDDTVLPKDYRAQYLKPYVDEGGGKSFYAYGWARLTTKHGKELAFHDGSNGMYFADCIRSIDEDSAVIILCNNYKVYPENLGWDIARSLFVD